MYVACSTLCFGRHSLEEALRTISELRFSKVDVGIYEHGRHLKPSEVAADVPAAAARLRYGPGLAPAAFSVSFDAPSEEEYQKQFLAICRLARQVAVSLVNVEPSPLEVPLEHELKRLARLVAVSEAEGIQVTVPTLIGTHTQTPEGAMTLCEKVRGLGLTLDPSHYTVGAMAGKCYDNVFAFVKHVHLRDTGRGPNQFQVRIGQGEIEYGRVVAQLERFGYKRALTVAIRDDIESPFDTEVEVRKLKLLLESLL